LREIEAFCAVSVVRVEAIGVARLEGTEESLCVDRARIDALKLWSSGAMRLPRSCRYLFELLELMIRVVPAACRREPRVVHCHDALMLPVGRLVKWVTGCALVYDAHELESEKSGQTWFLSWGTIMIERSCWSSVDLLVSVSQPIIDWYQVRLGPKPSVLVMNAPVLGRVRAASPALPQRMQGRPGYFHDRFRIPEAAKVFVYVGMLVPGRGIEHLLEVFGSPGARSHVVFMGDGDRVGVGEWSHRSPNVHLHPVVPHEQVVEYLRHADCGLCLIEDVSLSDYLCLPNKLFEYAFAGLPVLASRLPEIERMVRQFGLGMCCENSPAAIQAAVARIENDGLASAGLDLTDISWETQATRLCAAYEELLGESKSVAVAGSRVA
jgi:glycosyltransferase involved in cell wall biosynthesis